jgi:rare lipoprotein A
MSLNTFSQVACQAKLDVSSRSHVSRRVISVGCAALAGLLVANCANQQTALRSRSKEVGAFSHAKYGTASPRVVSDGEEVPKGGGRQHIGRPYTVAGKRYVPHEKPVGYTIVGNASWYGEAFHGRKTANGEVYDRHSITAAHPTMPLPSYARVTNTLNGRSIIVRVNDRGPYHGGRVLDVSQKTADALAFRHLGTARVRVDYIGNASLSGSDDSRLLASLRTDGQPAAMGGYGETTQIASAAPETAPVTPVARRVAQPAPQPQIPAAAAAYTAIEKVPSPAAVPVPAAAPAASAPPVIATPGSVTRVPTPPQRPFDLDTIPNAGALVSSLPSGSGRRPAQAGSTVAKLF